MSCQYWKATKRKNESRGNHMAKIPKVLEKVMIRAKVLEFFRN